MSQDDFDVIIIGAGSVGIINLIRGRRKKKATTARRATTRRKTTKRKARRPTTKRPKTKFQQRRARAFRGAKPKKIFVTKNGQPYIILKSGKARFIKKSSAKLRRRRKGGFS